MQDFPFPFPGNFPAGLRDRLRELGGRSGWAQLPPAERALWSAAGRGEVGEVRRLLAAPGGADVNRCDGAGESLLGFVCSLPAGSPVRAPNLPLPRFLTVCLSAGGRGCLLVGWTGTFGGCFCALGGSPATARVVAWCIADAGCTRCCTGGPCRAAVQAVHAAPSCC